MAKSQQEKCTKRVSLSAGRFISLSLPCTMAIARAKNKKQKYRQRAKNTWSFCLIQGSPWRVREVKSGLVMFACFGVGMVTVSSIPCTQFAPCSHSWRFECCWFRRIMPKRKNFRTSDISPSTRGRGTDRVRKSNETASTPDMTGLYRHWALLFTVDRDSVVVWRWRHEKNTFLTSPKSSFQRTKTLFLWSAASGRPSSFQTSEVRSFQSLPFSEVCRASRLRLRIIGAHD